MGVLGKDMKDARVGLSSNSLGEMRTLFQSLERWPLSLASNRPGLSPIGLTEHTVWAQDRVRVPTHRVARF